MTNREAVQSDDVQAMPSTVRWDKLNMSCVEGQRRTVVKARKTDWLALYTLWFIWILLLPFMYILAAVRTRKS